MKIYKKQTIKEMVIQSVLTFINWNLKELSLLDGIEIDKDLFFESKVFLIFADVDLCKNKVKYSVNSDGGQCYYSDSFKIKKDVHHTKFYKLDGSKLYAFKTDYPELRKRLMSINY